MLVIGLTGSIATGKSTVSALLSQPPYSLPIVDADVLAREVVAPGTRGHRAVVDTFLSSTPDLLLPPSPGKPEPRSPYERPLDRAALGRRVFGGTPDATAARAKLNAIVHPAVRRAMLAATLRAHARGAWAVVLDVPLLFEAGLDALCGCAVVVGVRDPEVQIRRLLARDAGRGLGEREARDRVASQGDVSGKVARARARGAGWGEVVWNDAGRQELEREVEALVGRLRAGSPRWWARVLWWAPPLAVVVAAWCVLRGWWARRSFERRREDKAKL